MVVPRAVVVVEAMAALTVMDMLLVSMSSRLDMIQLFFQVENVEGTDTEGIDPGGLPETRKTGCHENGRGR